MLTSTISDIGTLLRRWAVRPLTDIYVLFTSFIFSLSVYMCWWYSTVQSSTCDLGAVIVFVQETFERAKAWVKELQRQASPNIVIALAGNKADLAEKRLVEYEVTHMLI